MHRTACFLAVILWVPILREKVIYLIRDFRVYEQYFVERGPLDPWLETAIWYWVLLPLESVHQIALWVILFHFPGVQSMKYLLHHLSITFKRAHLVLWKVVTYGLLLNDKRGHLFYALNLLHIWSFGNIIKNSKWIRNPSAYHKHPDKDDSSNRSISSEILCCPSPFPRNAIDNISILHNGDTSCDE